MFGSQSCSHRIGKWTRRCCMKKARSVSWRLDARLGRPYTFISDKETNFAGAAREIKDCFNEWHRVVVCEQLTRGQIAKEFNAPCDEQFGGIRERLVRACEKAMFAILRNRRLTLPFLTSTMCLVEQTTNAWALTLVSDDLEDLKAPATKHFQLRRAVVAEPLMLDSARDIDCRKMHKVAEAKNQMIWNSWAK